MMKKLIKSAIILALTGIVMVGCEKEESPTNESIMQESLDKKEMIKLNNKAIEVTYIAEENFETEFEGFAADFFSEYPYGLINFDYISSTSQYALTTEPLGPKNPDSGDRIVCRGERSAVIACARNYARTNIFGCIPTVTRQYYSDESGKYIYRADVPENTPC